MPNYLSATRKPNVRSGNGSRRKRKGFIASFALRLVMITALVAVTSVVCYTALSNISRPYIYGARQASEIAEKTRSLKELNAENVELSQQSSYLSRPDGIEYEARMKGYLLPGERSLVIIPSSDSTNH